MFSISNMFVRTKRHRFTYLSALACISEVQPLCHQHRRHYTPGAFLQSKQRTFPQGCRKCYPVLCEKTAEQHQREDKSPPFPPTHQWGCSGSLPQMCPSTCGLKITRNVEKNPQRLVISPATVLMDGFRRKAPHAPKEKMRTLEPSAVDSVDLLPVWQHVRAHLSPGHPTPTLYPPLLSIQPRPSEVSTSLCLCRKV